MKLLHRISLYDNPYSVHKKRKFDKLTSNWTRMAASCLHFGHNVNNAYHVITGSDVAKRVFLAIECEKRGKDAI